MKFILFLVLVGCSSVVFGQSTPSSKDQVSNSIKSENMRVDASRVITEHLFVSEIDGEKVVTIFKTENGIKTSSIFRGEVAEQKLLEFEAKKAARSVKGYK